jgi:hypothetical protein
VTIHPALDLQHLIAANASAAFNRLAGFEIIGHRAILPVPMSDRLARGMGFVVSNGVRGTRPWSTWLRQRSTEARKAA